MQVEIIKISVRNLVEFILRSGDIDNRQGMMADKEAMQMGSRLHRKIQRQMGAAYRAEVQLKEEIDCQDYLVVVEGRADGIFTEKEDTWIDEIKGVCRDIGRMEEPVPVHLAQAKCYACIYVSQNNLEKIGVQMTYANLDTEEIRRFRQEYTLEELQEWFSEVLKQYQKWASFQIKWRRIRQASIAEVNFPYPYRDGQKALAGAVYRTIEREKKLFIQAPTGVGKTISTVFPAVKAVGQGLGEKIFYLTAKTITRTVAQEAFSLLKQNGLQYKVITLTAKEKLCFCEEPDCNPEKCPYARGHYDRINDAVFELLATPHGDYTRETVLSHAEKWKVCPFEMSLDLSLWTDAVICDYNYVFDPQAKLKRFFSDGVKGDHIFLIDEAHNLVERGREMYSASLYKEDFLEIKRLLKPVSKKAERALEKCNRIMLEWKRECEGYTLFRDIGSYIIGLMNVSAQLENLLEDREGPLNRLHASPAGDDTALLRKKVLEFYFQVRNFLDIYEDLDDSYEIYAEQETDGRFKVKLFCIHTAGKIGECLDRGRAAVFFSATLLPVRYYMELLSGKETDYAVYAQSTFSPEMKKVLVGNDVSSRYTRRNMAEYKKISDYIWKMVEAKRGNYLVFFPSYKMLEEVRDIFETKAPEQIQVISQNSRMTEAEREEFLEHFSHIRADNCSLIGFCVMGGIFGEGIDLKHEQLIGAVVVGTGLPQVCNEREILKKYYDRKDMDGFAYAYQYPGMNKVMQSAGRVIRTDEDKGVILLLDERFCNAGYRSIFPREWADFEVCSLQSAGNKIEQFWKRFE
ncbi:MAG: ATP-dependent DNA helicase [Eubacteriales bacterium]|nr:ATP-dependent DNA helicase [Eubacteriales bacterium]